MSGAFEDQLVELGDEMIGDLIIIQMSCGHAICVIKDSPLRKDNYHFCSVGKGGRHVYIRCTCLGQSRFAWSS